MRAWSISPSPSQSPRPHERARHGRERPRRQSRGRGPHRARRARARAGAAGESHRRAAARGVRAIVHAAAIVQRRASWEQYVAVNVDATRLAVAAARAAGARLIHISSVAVYAGSAAYPSVPERRDEDFPFQPIAAPDLYARSKRMAEDVVRDAAAHRDVHVVALRPTVIYGERDRLFTPRVIRAARLRFVPRIGPGTNRLSCVYAGNVAAAAAAALDAPLQGFRAYNVTSDGP